MTSVKSQSDQQQRGFKAEKAAEKMLFLRILEKLHFIQIEKVKLTLWNIWKANKSTQFTTAT